MGLGAQFPAWRTASSELKLEGKTVHVWRASAEVIEPYTHHLAATLSAKEIAIAGRFAHERDRMSFARHRGLLRVLLGWYLRTEPARVPIREGAHGKLELSVLDGLASLRFNLSHTQGLAVFAFTLAGDIGIDVERMNPSLDVERMLPWIMSPTECARVRSLPQAERLAALYGTWTLHEACAKAVGMGLGPWLDRVRGGESDGTGLCRASGMWTCPLPVGSGFAGSLALRGDPPALDYLEWPGDSLWFTANSAG